ncbi:MAG: hypothetical protein SFU87_03725 [Chitinophagaceae bacterium]|nr:hypothetical protein [Chitinophagaceae bacterium]
MENADSASKLLVIVAEKINIKEEKNLIDSVSLLNYSKFTAHYRILEKVCGDYNKDTITFTAYDHYGFPSFGNYQYALLYLNVTKKGIFHEIYLYSDLYKTKEGRWASPYSVLDYGRLDENRNTMVKPEKLDFGEEVSFSIEGFTRARTQKWFPEPYYKIDKERKKAIAVWGNYVPELFQLQKETVLKARGIFGKPDPIVHREVQIERTQQMELSKKDSFELLKTWKSLVNSLKTNDIPLIKNISFDSIICSVCEGMPKEYYENNIESIDMFIDSAFTNFQRAGLWPLIDKNKYKIYVTSFPERKPQDIPLKDHESLIIFKVGFLMKLKTSYSVYQQRHSFEFVKIDGRFRLYKMETH